MLAKFDEVEKITIFGRENIPVFVHRPKSLKEVFDNAAKNQADQIALILEDESLTYREFDDLATKVASSLNNKYGIKKGDHVFSLIGNLLEFPILMNACAKLGAVVIPVNTKLAVSEIAYIIGHSKPDIIVSEKELVNVVKESAKQFPEVAQYTKDVIVIEDAETEGTFKSLYKNGTNFEEPNLVETDPAYILYTSGTTGRPKGAVLSHINVIHSIIHYYKLFESNPEMRTTIAVPLFHVTGLVAQFLHMVFAGGSSLILRQYQNEKYIEQSYKYQVNCHFNVPTIFIMMATSPLVKKYPFDHVKRVAYGGSPIYLQTLEKLQEIFPNATFHNVYGATETTSPATAMPAQYPMSKASSVGKPVPLGEIKIVDSATGRELGPNEVGEIYIKGPMVVGYYHDNDEANRTAFDGGFWKSGDLGKIDEDGFIYVLDRMKDMINRGGEKVFSIEVEDVLKKHPEIVEAAVVANPDDIYGERVKAFIVSDSLNEQSIADIQAHCAKNLAKYKVPEIIEFIDELPKTASGKIMKHKLKSLSK